MKLLIGAAILSASLNTVAAGNPAAIIKGEFEGNGKVSYFTYDAANIAGGADYFSSSTGKVRHYDIAIQGVCDSVELYASDGKKNEVVLDGSCSGQGAQVDQYVYRWDSQRSEWCLKEEIVGEKADQPSGVAEHLTHNSFSGCTLFGAQPD
jgi:hypothetical protein